MARHRGEGKDKRGDVRGARSDLTPGCQLLEAVSDQDQLSTLKPSAAAWEGELGAENSAVWCVGECWVHHPDFFGAM